MTLLEYVRRWVPEITAAHIVEAVVTADPTCHQILRTGKRKVRVRSLNVREVRVASDGLHQLRIVKRRQHVVNAAGCHLLEKLMLGNQSRDSILPLIGCIPGDVSIPHLPKTLRLIGWLRKPCYPPIHEFFHER